VKDLGVDAQAGDLDDWQRRRAEAAEAAAPAPRPERTGGQGKDARRERAVQREKRLRALGPLREEIARIEEGIARIEQRKKDAEAELADPGVFKDPARSTSAVAAYRDAQQDLEELYQRWEGRQEELQRAEARLAEE
jgi:ATP-binding cassette subfamily F protein 3